MIIKELLIKRIESLGGFRYVSKHPELWDDCVISYVWRE